MSAKHQRERKKTSAKPSRKTAASHAVAKKLALPKGRVSKARLMELTAELDNQMVDVRTVHSTAENAFLPPLPQEGTQTVRDLAEVLRGL